MTTNEKLNYIIQLLSQITNEAKAINQLNDYTLGSNDPTSFLATFVSVDGDSQKFSIQDLIDHVTVEGIETHQHAITDIVDLASALGASFVDPSSNVWQVERTAADYDYTRLLQDDFIRGWSNGAKTHWYEGVVLDGTLVLPTDLTDPAKFFITNQKLKV